MTKSSARRSWPMKGTSPIHDSANYLACLCASNRRWRPSVPDASTTAGPDLPTMLFVFMLASFIGLGVITRVSRLLHTPLMSITNAISAIAVVGAITVAGSDHPFYINLLGAIALFASTTNIVSGFLITDRMLKMFKRQERK